MDGDMIGPKTVRAKLLKCTWLAVVFCYIGQARYSGLRQRQGERGLPELERHVVIPSLSVRSAPTLSPARGSVARPVPDIARSALLHVPLV
jgi:hypothetical protein